MLFLPAAVLPQVMKCRQGKVSACTLVLVSQEVAMELSVATSMSKCFSLLISGQLFATKFYEQELPFLVAD